MTLTFEQFVEREFPALGRFAGALTGNRELAEDVLSDALLKVSEHWSRVARADSPLAYTRRIITNTFLSQRRSGARLRELAVPNVPDEPIADHSDGVTTRHQVRQLLATLTPTQRAAVVLRYYLDLPDEEIGAALACSAATVRSHLSHARRALRLAADEQSSAPEGKRA